MTVDEVKARVEEIRTIQWDDKEAHIMEDALYKDLLASIASQQCSDPWECARQALEVLKMDFVRWYA